mgnify:CR=1 FL=1
MPGVGVGVGVGCGNGVGDGFGGGVGCGAGVGGGVGCGAGVGVGGLGAEEDDEEEEGMSGFASMTGEENQGPLLPPTALADMISGLSGISAIMFALFAQKNKKVKPWYQHIKKNTIPTISENENIEIKVLVGEINGTKSKVQTYSPVSIFDIQFFSFVDFTERV